MRNERFIAVARLGYTKAKSQLTLPRINQFFILISVVSIVWFLFRLPSAGIAIGFLGAVGVIVALVGDNHLKSTKVLWAMITLCFLVIEVRAITKDRKDQYDQFTGGDDFGYVIYKDGGGFTFAHQGEHVLFDVWVRFVDLKTLNASSTWQDLFKYNFHLGDFGLSQFPGTSTGTMIDSPPPFTDSNRQDFNIFFNARNGFWEQALRLRFVNGHWSTATKVIRRHPKSRSAETLYERIDKDYPRNSRGEVDW